jgi:hypothetical protein
LGSGILSEGRVTRNATTTIEPRAAVCGNSGSPDCHNNLVTFSGTCPNLPDGTCPPA